jgi:hypothetical protein
MPTLLTPEQKIQQIIQNAAKGICATLGRLKASEPSLKAELTHAFTNGEHVASIL